MALFETSDKIMLVFVAFSIPFYILFLLTILINRHKEPFNSPFFILCFSLGIADVATLFHTYIFVKAPGWSWGHLFWMDNGYPGSFLSYYVFVLLWGLSFAQNIGVVLIAINRFTAVVFTFRHQRIWSTQNISIAIAIQWIVPVLFVAPMMTTEFEYGYWGAVVCGNKTEFEGSDNVNIIFCDYNYEEGYFIAAALINLTANSTTCFMYVAVLFTALRVVKNRVKVEPVKISSSSTKSAAVLHKNGNEVEEIPEVITPVDNGQLFIRRNTINSGAALSPRSLPLLTTTFNQKKAQTASQKVAYDRELRLAVSGFLMFIAMFIYFLFLLSVLFVSSSNDFGALYNVSTDIFSCVSPYTLFLMSKQTRVALKKTLTCKKI